MSAFSRILGSLVYFIPGAALSCACGYLLAVNVALSMFGTQAAAVVVDPVRAWRGSIRVETDGQTFTLPAYIRQRGVPAIGDTVQIVYLKQYPRLVKYSDEYPGLWFLLALLSGFAGFLLLMGRRELRARAAQCK